MMPRVFLTLFSLFLFFFFLFFLSQQLSGNGHTMAFAADVPDAALCAAGGGIRVRQRAWRAGSPASFFLFFFFPS
jgi:hypothetical protein